MTADTVLVVTASYDEGADYVIKVLNQNNVTTFRLNTDEFPSKVHITFQPPNNLTFSVDEEVVSGESIKSVWYRRFVPPELPEHLEPGIREFCERESRAFLQGVLASLPTTRWMSSPQMISKAERKPYQLALASQLGFTIPKTIITNDQASIKNLIQIDRLIAKAVSSGYVTGPEGNRAIFTSELKTTDLDDLTGLALAPVIFQEFVEKFSDIRVTVVDQEVYAAEILSQGRESSKIDWRATDDPGLPHRRHELPSKMVTLCRELVSRLNLSFGAIDLALKPDGSYVFFEINPNGEWMWIEDKLGFPISKGIAQWLNIKSN